MDSAHVSESLLNLSWLGCLVCPFTDGEPGVGGVWAAAGGALTNKIRLFRPPRGYEDLVSVSLVNVMKLMLPTKVPPGGYW